MIDNDKVSELSDKVGALAVVATTVSVAVDRLTERVRRGQVKLIMLAVSVALDLILSFGFFYALHGTNDAQHQTKALIEQIAKDNNATRERCQARNDSSNNERALWAGLLALPKAPGTAPTDPTTLAAFNMLLDKTFYQTDCEAIGK